MTESALTPSIHQAAGHDGHSVLGEHHDLFVKTTTHQEVEFYSHLQEYFNDDQNRILGENLADWTPVLLGVLQKGIYGDLSHGQIQMPSLKQDRILLEREPPGEKMHKKTPSDVQEDEIDASEYLVLQNLYFGFDYPCIMDIKLGSVLYDENASKEKAKRLDNVSKTTTSGSLGFRICGMKIHCKEPKEVYNEVFPGMQSTIAITQTSDGENYAEFDKFYGRRLNTENIKSGIALYFHSVPNKKIEIMLMEIFLNRLRALYNCLLDTEVRIVSGSLLFIYEGNIGKWDQINDDHELCYELNPLVREDFLGDSDTEDEEIDEEADSRKSQVSKRCTPLSSLNMIDFAHARFTPGKGYDENIINGIENLIKIFEERLKELS